MQAILYVSHGSRVEETKREAFDFIKQVQENIAVPLYEISFLELASPTIEEGIRSLVEKGATRIAVIPVLLLRAGHYYEDIPEELALIRGQYPEVTFTYGEPLGVQERIVDVLVERLREVQPGRGADILLVGRGSRNPATKQAIEGIATQLATKIGKDQVHTCYLAACAPSFDEKLSSLIEASREIVVVPYLWFTGLLIESMKKKMAPYPHVKMGHYLHDHPYMIAAQADRVMEAVEKKEEMILG